MKLFIIGNGFDCHHRLPTKYSDFRNYIIYQFPNALINQCSVPESIQMPDGEEIYDDKKVVGYIVNIIDDCEGSDWNDLESFLGDNLYRRFKLDLPRIDFDGNDNQMFRDVYNREEMSKDMSNVFKTIKLLFEDWVKNELGNLEYNTKYDEKVATILDSDSVFLNFNYTETLQKLYGIKNSNICYIHGKANDGSEIYFGHGDDEPIPDSFDFIGCDDIFEKLKNELHKNTQKALDEHSKFFKSIANVREIYSFGFSFSDVDMIYIEKISRKVDLQNTIWYLNTYDWKNKKDYKKKLENLGFTVKLEDRW